MKFALCAHSLSFNHSLNAMVTFVGLGLGFATTQILLAAQSQVAMDVPAILIAEPVNPAVVNAPTLTGNLYRLQFTISAKIASDFRGKVNEYVVELSNPYRTMRVLELWPSTQVYSDIEGNISVEDRFQQDKSLAFNASGAFEPFARGSAEGEFRENRSVHERYVRKPTVQQLTASGTIDRGFGAFFKFRTGPLPAEGEFECALLVEVPTQWRSGMIQMNLRAMGSRSSDSINSRPEVLGSAQLWTAVYRYGDIEAAEQARLTAQQESALRSVAARKYKQIEERTYPTIFHKVGAALDVIDPRIPENFMAQILFGPEDEFFNERTNRLPVDLRVAALDYWDQRKKFLSL